MHSFYAKSALCCAVTACNRAGMYLGGAGEGRGWHIGQLPLPSPNSLPYVHESVHTVELEVTVL